MALFRILALFVLSPALLFAQANQDSLDAARVEKIIHAAAAGNRQQIVQLIHYPLGRTYPVPSIQNPKECLQRFDEIFDGPFLSKIASSDSKHDWGRAGWRGIAFGLGEMWLDEDYKIIAINHDTEAGKAVRARLIAQQKQRLPLALRDFDEPMLEFKTKHFLIRVDLKGDDHRLLVFKGHSYKHLLYMKSHGDFEFDGSGGNSHIDWVSKDLSFRLIDDQMSPGPEYTFQEFKGTPGQFRLDDPLPILEETGHEEIR
jgi:hypothetical protein